MKLEQSEYVLGHTNAEQLRLIRQARVLAPFTNRLFRDAGIASGMRVLDIGCGMGDVTMLAAQLVGPSGRVVSIDRDQASIETAQRRVSAIGLENVKFYQADLLTFEDAESFDAIVSRLVLEFLPDTTAVIKRLSMLLRGRAGSWRFKRRRGGFGLPIRPTCPCEARSQCSSTMPSSPVR